MKGFTLVELLVSLTIVGIMLGVGVANFSAYSRAHRLTAAATSIIADLRATQEKAMSGQKPTGCGVGNALLRYEVTFAANSYSVLAVCTGGAPTAKTIAVATGMTIATPLPVPNPIFFKVLGQGTNIPDGGSAVIKITDGKSGVVDVTVTSGGEIR